MRTNHVKEASLRAGGRFRSDGLLGAREWTRSDGLPRVAGSFGSIVPVLVGAWVLLASGCSTERDINDLFVPQDVGVLVIDAVLTVNENFPSIRVTRTGSPSSTYDINDVVHSGSLEIRQAGDVVARYTFDSTTNFWKPGAGNIRVLADTEYELILTTAAAEKLRATTITPPPLSIEDWVLLDDAGEAVIETLATYATAGSPDDVFEENQLVYAAGLLEARFDRPNVPAFEVAIFSLDLDSDYVIDPDFFDPEDFEDLDRIGSSPPLEGENGILRLPWFAIFFQGRYSIKVYSMDQNWYDLARSAPGFGDGGPGFGGQAGDDFERPIFHVEGGIGLFGSAAVDSIGFTVLPRP